jgi:hypothetical protein
MLKLIERCLADDGQAWADLWGIYDHIAAQPVRRLIVRAGFDQSDADDVAMEIFERLRQNRCRRLRSFRGASEIKFNNWLVKVAANFTHDWIERRWRQRKREKRALSGLSEPVRDAPTDEELQSLMQELKGVLSREDFDHLRKIAGVTAGESPTLGASTGPLSARTERRWKDDLEQKVSEHLGFVDRKRRRPRRKRKK